jgi:hypothetical protein
MMSHISSKIRFEVSGHIRNSTKYAIEDKLKEIAPKLDENVIASVKHFTHIHESASWNDYKKTKHQGISVSLVIPELKEYEGIGETTHKSSVILASGFYFKPILEAFKGYSFDGVNCHFDENGRKSVSVEFERNTKI